MCQNCNDGYPYDDKGRRVIEGVTWWDGEGITINNLHDEVIRLAEEFPEQQVDCKYSSRGEPVCIVGQAVYNITGQVVNDDSHGGSIRWSDEWLRILGITYNYPDAGTRESWTHPDPEQLHKFELTYHIQKHQDGNLSWGTSLDRARRDMES